MRKSSEIFETLQLDGKSFKCNDSIAEYLSDADREDLIDDVADAFRLVLQRLLIDIDNDPNSKDTPQRLARMYVNEVMRGRYHPKPDMTLFPNDTDRKYDGLLVVRAEIDSMCAHHHQPMSGVAYIGIIPNGHVLGLSKYIRIAQWCARRGQIQEELTGQIADEVSKATNVGDVAVHMALTHGCCEHRGVMAHSSLTQTTVLRGSFKRPDLKKEFFDNVAMQDGRYQ